MPLLKVDDLRITFGEKVAVDGVDLEVDAGEVLALVGESGSGKSVTALSTLGLIGHLGGTIERGAVRYGSQDLATLSERAWRSVRGSKIAMVFQDPTAALNPVQRVGNQIAEQIRAHDGIRRPEARRRAIALLATVGLPDPERRSRWYPHQFSGGMRQRVAIAMALSCAPDVLVADEPTTSLDATVQAQILELLRALKDDRGLSVLLITHDMGVVAGVADRVAVMYGGRIVETGSASAVLAGPRHPYTRGLIASVPSLRAAEPPVPIRGEPGSVTAERRGCLFAPRCALYEAGPCDEPQRRVLPGDEHAAACWRTTADTVAEVSG